MYYNGSNGKERLYSIDDSQMWCTYCMGEREIIYMSVLVTWDNGCMENYDVDFLALLGPPKRDKGPFIREFLRTHTTLPRLLVACTHYRMYRGILKELQDKGLKIKFRSENSKRDLGKRMVQIADKEVHTACLDLTRNINRGKIPEFPPNLQTDPYFGHLLGLSEDRIIVV